MVWKLVHLYVQVLWAEQGRGGYAYRWTWVVGLPYRRQIDMSQKSGSFMSGVAAFSRSINGRLTLMKHKNALALLKAQLILPIQTQLDIASSRHEIDIQLQDPKLRKTFESIELTLQSGLTTTIQPADFAVDLDNVEKEFQRDAAFAALLAHTRQEFSNELRKVRGKLQGNRPLLEAFRMASSAPDQLIDVHDALCSLNRLGSLSTPAVPPSQALLHETGELTALLQSAPATG